MPRNYKNQEYIEVKTDSQSYVSIIVLDFLNGKPFDDIAKAYISGLNPTSVRIIYDSEHLDARTGRVTVYLDDNDIIEKISQEITVHLPESVRHGGHLGICLRYGMNSPQAEWYRDDTITGYLHDGINGIYYKCTANGRVPFPKFEKED
jgi:hypothetical protein